MVIDVGRDLERMQNYIVGRLSSEEQRVFEDRLLRDPGLVRELEQSLQMREGLQQLREQDLKGAPASRGRRRPAWLPALAAAGLAGLALFLWVQPRPEAAGVLVASPAARGAGVTADVGAHFTFLATRSGAIPDLDLPASGLVELRATPGTRITQERYRVTLLRQDDAGAVSALGMIARVAPGADGYVYCYADASRLRPGNYVLRVEADAGSDPQAEEFPFRLRRAATRSSG